MYIFGMKMALEIRGLGVPGFDQHRDYDRGKI
jgi:hypothetical protein